MRLSIFTDELGIDITEGISTLADWGMKWVDLRSRTLGKAAETLDADEMKRLRQLIRDKGLKVACLETSLGKVHLPDAQRVAAEMQKLENIIRLAEAMDCRLVRAFFFWQPKDDLRGQLAVRPDELQKVLDLAGPMCQRAKQAGLTLAFENCGVSVEENFAVLDALKIDGNGLAWDPANEWVLGVNPNDKAIAERARRTRCVHVKAVGCVPGLHQAVVPWQKILLVLSGTGYEGPVSIETHNPDKSVSNIEMSRRVLEKLKQCWPGEAPLAKVKTKCDFKPVCFVMVGLGMGATRAKEMLTTSGVELAGVCDLQGELAEKVGKDLGVPHTTDLRPWLDRKDIEAVFVVTETGNHGKVCIQALRAGKHVISTKPMDASTAACDEMIAEAQKAGKLLAVDFAMRLTPAIQRMKQRVDRGDLGKLLGGNMFLKVLRTDEYFLHNHGWRGTWRLDGGGAMSNQNIHHVDELIFVLGLPKRVSMRMWTQNHKIEAEDLGLGLWEYDGAVVQVAGTTCYPQSTWYHSVELHGTAGAMMRSAGGPVPGGIERWYTGGKWETSLPEAPRPPYETTAQNLAAAIRIGAPLYCDGRDGRRSRVVLDAMYHSARNDGMWVEIPKR